MSGEEVSGVAAATAPLVVRRLQVGDSAAVARWEAFVDQCPQATFFHRAGWQRVIGEVFRHPTHFLYAERAGQLEGVLPLAQVKSLLFGNALVSLPFAVYGGVAASTPQAADLLEDEAQAIARSLEVDHLELRNVRERHPEWPQQDLYVRFRRAIVPDLEANMLAIPRKQRAMVRKGMKSGLRSEIDSDSRRFFALYADNVHRHGTPALPQRYFERLLQVFAGSCDIMTVVDEAGRPVSSVLSFYFRDEVLPYYAGDEPSARNLAANDFKYWELLRRSCERGLKVFDYGRSKRDTGSYSFKKNWGFEPEPLFYEYCLYRRETVPQNNPANAKYRLLINTWQRMPLGLANWLGPFIVRNLG
ncbi:MAG: FemAB-related protein, PEP-CTERM system-associated [Candidatus Accumulibacter sp. BA-94]|uniref:FemAB family XrtA/PEP-CTERM system-associated protein n=1 Tax=Accumulibacter sp. TaxID=2053492 RepID=UPI00044ADB06|nr:FemAB family XrtA/PEP-CTERM system-associated protein [Accumulibacter sp.]EXI91774.1 MAG: FemAB-related protein, PEP-CTERM system-associated [Candidatus Accumulibacter sp. BA-94]MBL8391617.1 FemAB family PEP-CTERM system-associated protein [Accumulibacter sp.]HRD86744.1 FemAB family PEP-CTERM system-associated protein [Accumulibacter sp.]